MNENKYDDAHFFEQYSKMKRSTRGLKAAGEWECLRGLLPDFSGKRVLDLGCGYGWHCIYAAKHGATSVMGIDLSSKMIEEAHRRNSAPQITYRCCDMDEFSFPAETYDIVLSSLAFHYLKDFNAVCRNVYKTTAKDGTFIFSVEHPIFTAQGPQNWHCSPDGVRLHWPVDRYFDEGPRTAVFLGEEVQKYHRTLTSYINALLQAGFEITALAEPRPPQKMLAEPGMTDELRRPMMLIISARKNNSR